MKKYRWFFVGLLIGIATGFVLVFSSHAESAIADTPSAPRGISGQVVSGEVVAHFTVTHRDPEEAVVALKFMEGFNYLLRDIETRKTEALRVRLRRLLMNATKETLGKVRQNYYGLPAEPPPPPRSNKPAGPEHVVSLATHTIQVTFRFPKSRDDVWRELGELEFQYAALLNQVLRIENATARRGMLGVISTTFLGFVSVIKLTDEELSPVLDKFESLEKPGANGSESEPGNEKPEPRIPRPDTVT